MKSWPLAAGFGFAAAFTAAPAQAGPPCQFCLDLRSQCLAQAGTLEEQAACHREFMACRADGCPPV